MTQRSQPQVVRSYLKELEAALTGVPSAVAREIVGGVAEELAGMDVIAATARIKELGDPAFIAEEAKAGSELHSVPEVEAPSTARTGSARPAGAVEPQWYIVVASLLVAIGGVVVPVAGWIVGIGMVTFSKAWSPWEKVVAIFSPFAFLALLLAGAGLMSVLGSGLTWWHLAILTVFVVPFLSGMWLLWRGLRRL